MSGKLDISVQCSKKLAKGRRSINTLVNPVKTDFDDDSKKQTDKRDCGDEMLADGKFPEKQEGERTLAQSTTVLIV